MRIWKLWNYFKKKIGLNKKYISMKIKETKFKTAGTQLCGKKNLNLIIICILEEFNIL